MRKIKQFPRYRMKVTLTPHWQNVLLTRLSQTLGIMESFSTDHEIFMGPSAFMVFMNELAKMENPPTLKQLKLEQIDLRKLPERSFVNYLMPGDSHGEESKRDDNQ